jgi:hypothetical protein
LQFNAKGIEFQTVKPLQEQALYGLCLSENAKPAYRGFCLQVVLAEKEGFEPPVRSPGQRFSRPPQSTTLPFLRRKDSKILIFQL